LHTPEYVCEISYRYPTCQTPSQVLKLFYWDDISHHLPVEVLSRADCDCNAGWCCAMLFNPSNQHVEIHQFLFVKSPLLKTFNTFQRPSHQHADLVLMLLMLAKQSNLHNMARLQYKIPLCSGQPLWFCRENSRGYFKKLYFNIT
jgi:hypothetical protein